MMQRIFSFFSRTVNGLHEAAYIIAFFAFLSQLLGLVRDRILAHMFGASGTLDVYYAAFRIPDVIFASIASFVSLFVLIPFLTKRIEENGGEARRFLSEITTVFTVFMIAVSGVLYFFVPQLSRFLYPGFSSEQVEMLSQLTRILLLSPIFLGLSNIVASITQIKKKFFIYALSPILYNLGIIAGVLALYPLWGMRGLAYGVVLGSFLHLAIQIPTIIRERLMPKLTLAISWSDIFSVIHVSIPRTMTLAFNQIVLLALLGIASKLSEGSIAVFTFAMNINLAPLTIIGVSYSVAAFPTLSKLFSNGDREVFVSHLLTAIRHILFWSLPAIALFIVLRAHIVRVLLGSGAFDWTATRLTAATMGILMLSLAAHGLMLLFVRGYYAAGKTARPFWINIMSSVVTLCAVYAGIALFRGNETFRLFVEALFRVEDVPGTVVLMVSLGYTVGMIANAAAFWLLFRRDFGGHVPRGIYTSAWQGFAASVLAGAAAYAVLAVTQGFVDLDSFWGVFSHGFVAGIAGIVTGIGVLLLLKNTEMKEIWSATHARFWASKPIAPSPEEI
ncbi:MAG: hypothetical protein AMXMBFR44_6060 [Candidatus Campbellbacteria bacterium]